MPFDDGGDGLVAGRVPDLILAAVTIASGILILETA
jgi:hypothetical protein